MKKWSEFLFNQVKWQVTQANYWKRKFASSYVRKNHVLGCQIVIYVYSIFVFSRIGMAEKFMRPTHSYWINWIVSLSSEYERQTSKTIDSTIHNNIDDDSEIKILCLRGITLISVVRLQCNIFTEHFSGKSHSQTERRQFQFPVYATNEQHFWRKETITTKFTPSLSYYQRSCTKKTFTCMSVEETSSLLTQTNIHMTIWSVAKWCTNIIRSHPPMECNQKFYCIATFFNMFITLN